MEHIKDNTQRSKNILMAFATLALIDVISIGLTIYQNSILIGYDSGEYFDEDVDLLDTIVAAIGIFQFVCIIVVIVLFIQWFRRAYGNLTRLNIPMEYSENTAVWGYFIPFLNWVRPIRTVKEIYVKTQEAIKTYQESLLIDRNIGFILVWWIAYLINGVIGNVASKFIERADTIEKHVEANKIYIFSDIWDILSIALAILVIQKISKLELTLKNTDKSKSLIDQIGSIEEF